MELQNLHFLREWIKTQLDNPDAQFNLRDKQVQAFCAFASNDFTDEQIAHSYFKLPTGFGKTVMFSYMARAYFDAIKQAGVKKQKIIIIVPRLSLIKQTQNKLNNFAEIHATEYSGRKKDNESDVIITTYNSLEKLFGIINFNDVGLIFADEAHHMLGNKIYKQLQYYNNFVPVIGFTATPEYEVNRAVADMLNTEIFSMNIPESVETGVLCPVKNVLYRSSIVCDLSEIPLRTNGEYDYGAISSRISPNTLADEIASIYAYGADDDTGIKFKNLKAIINCPNAEIANMQANKINEIVGDNVAVSLHKVGIKDKHFEQLQQDFIDGKYSVACQVGTMTEGFDDVTVSLCINYPTRSRVKEEQTSGRVIRIDENNKDKIAFVVDTVFRRTKNESVEDILYTASNAQQVLFKDIAGGMILYPNNFDIKHVRNGKAETYVDKKVNFVDFELITDKVTLMDLASSYKTPEETLEEKTDDWQSAPELAKDETFKMNDKAAILKKLIELQPQMPESIKTLKTQKGKTGLYLLKTARQEFLSKFDYYDDIPYQTENWLSATELAQNPEFALNDAKVISHRLQEQYKKMPEYIKVLKPKKGGPRLCLFWDAREIFLKAIYFDIPPKTQDWYSSTELANNPNFIIKSHDTISNKLTELQPEMSQYIKLFKSKKGVPCLCLHKDGLDLFIKKLGFDIPQKTSEWLTVSNLAADKDFNMNDNETIRKNIEKLKNEMPEYIQLRRLLNGVSVLCLHKDGRKLFLEKAGFANEKKPEGWYSAKELADGSKINITSQRVIYTKLKELKSEMPQYIKSFKPVSGKSSTLYLAKEGIDLFIKKAGFDTEIKTDEWNSARELAKNPEFKLKDSGTIYKKMQEYQAQMPQYIKTLKPQKGMPTLYLHKDGWNLFFELMRKSKTKSIQNATQAVSKESRNADVITAIKNSREPNN